MLTKLTFLLFYSQFSWLITIVWWELLNLENQNSHTMNLFVKYNFETTCRVILKEQLDKFNFDYTITGMGSVTFSKNVPMEQYQKLTKELKRYGIDIIDNQKAILVQKIKEAIISMLQFNNNMPLVKISSYLSESLNESYRTLSQVFSEVCHISIESFIIINKIELVKQLLINDNLSLTEISYRLHYSSVAHLSNQFKKITGLTPTTFQKIVKHKRSLSIALN